MLCTPQCCACRLRVVRPAQACQPAWHTSPPAECPACACACVHSAAPAPGSAQTALPQRRWAKRARQVPSPECGHARPARPRKGILAQGCPPDGLAQLSRLRERPTHGGQTGETINEPACRGAGINAPCRLRRRRARPPPSVRPVCGRARPGALEPACSIAKRGVSFTVHRCRDMGVRSA